MAKNIQNDVRKSVLSKQAEFINNVNNNFIPENDVIDLSKSVIKKEIKENKLEKNVVDYAKETDSNALLDFIIKSNDEDLIKAAKDELIQRELDSLSKGMGEGSKGGKIIGHTKSGKPIYDSPSHKDHKDFSADDHVDAAEIHKKLWSKSVGKGNSLLSSIQDENFNKVHKHINAAKSKNKENEGKEQSHGEHKFIKDEKGGWNLHGKKEAHNEVKHGTKVGVMSSGKEGKESRTGVIVKEDKDEHHVLMNDSNKVEKHKKHDLYNNEDSE